MSAAKPATGALRPMARLERWLLPPLLLALVLLAAVEPRPEVIEEGAETRVQQRILLQDTQVNESSGLVCSLSHPGLFWTHNDSFGAPRLFAIDQRGQTRAVLHLRDAPNLDWEDLATWRRSDGSAVLVVADIGDNLHVRSGVDFYEVPEPSNLPPPQGGEILVKPTAHWRVKYPDGRHNAEAFAIDPRSGRAWVVTKDSAGHSALYSFSVAQPPDGKVITLQRMAALELPPRPRVGKAPHHAQMVTGASIAADGRWFALATYSVLLEWPLDADGDVAAALKGEPKLLTPPLLKQLEAIAHAPGQRAIWCSSEQLPAAFYQLRLEP